MWSRRPAQKTFLAEDGSSGRFVQFIPRMGRYAELLARSSLSAGKEAESFGWSGTYARTSSSRSFLTASAKVVWSSTSRCAWTTWANTCRISHVPSSAQSAQRR